MRAERLGSYLNKYLTQWWDAKCIRIRFGPSQEESKMNQAGSVGIIDALR